MWTVLRQVPPIMSVHGKVCGLNESQRQLCRDTKSKPVTECFRPSLCWQDSCRSCLEQLRHSMLRNQSLAVLTRPSGCCTNHCSDCVYGCRMILRIQGGWAPKERQPNRKQNKTGNVRIRNIDVRSRNYCCRGKAIST